jgi:hypothetical protein
MEWRRGKEIVMEKNYIRKERREIIGWNEKNRHVLSSSRAFIGLYPPTPPPFPSAQRPQFRLSTLSAFLYAVAELWPL